MLQHGKRPTIASRHGIVAAADALNVVEPYMSGLAGQGLATCYIASEKRVRSLNFMSRIPRKFPLDKLNRREQVLRGPVAGGAPGNLAGWCEMVNTYGTQK